MSRSSKLSEEERDEMRSSQADAFQALLFTMDQLGERSAFMQLEIDGVLRSVVAREFTQQEFEDLMREVVVRK